MSHANERNPHTISAGLGSPAATTVYPLFKTLKAFKLVQAEISVTSAVAQDDTNYGVFTLKAGATTLASFSTKTTGGDGALSAAVSQALSLAAANAAGTSKIPAGTEVSLTFTKAGTSAPVNLRCHLNGYYL